MDLHPTDPWMLASLYNGNVHLWNYENQGRKDLKIHGIFNDLFYARSDCG
jgi:hypothetical protein